MKSYTVGQDGFYGQFGGAYVPEILYGTLEALRTSYQQIIESEDFLQEYYQLLRDYVGRPSPLYFARRMSEKYGCKLYLKREDLNHTGAHKINNAIGQILLARRMGKKRIIAETGAGQHGVATATVCALMNMPCRVYMGALDVQRQHVNVERMKMLGAEVFPVESGNKTLKDATSVISKEIRFQLQEKEGRDWPDYLIACVGGGSNAAGTVYHYLDDERVKIVLGEAGGKGMETEMTAASLNIGTVGILHGSRIKVMQTDDGQIIEPYSISAGLDYPGTGPMHCNLFETGRAKVLAVNDDEALAAAFELTRLEGIIPALESSHALALLSKIKFKPEDVVVLTVSGRGDKDLATYLAHSKDA